MLHDIPRLVSGFTAVVALARVRKSAVRGRDAAHPVLTHAAALRRGLETASRLLVVGVLLIGGTTYAQSPAQARRPTDDAELERWLQNMVWHHRFSREEVTAATGLSSNDVEAALSRLRISPTTRPGRPADAPLLVLPYPGGRHPRIGFLEGAIDPQRETKVSVFLPWDDSSYVVVDVPEAIWSNLGLTYLAHTHIPTIWDERGQRLRPQEWTITNEGDLTSRRRLPNGIEFGSRIHPERASVQMEMWLTNGTPQTLTDLRVQNCVMLKGARGFEQPTNDNKVFPSPYAVCRSQSGSRWIITAWDPVQRTWGNADCPCLHSDPQFPDCPPGETQRICGWLSFYEGDDLPRELQRIEATGWRQ